MKESFRTHAIGRHLVNVPDGARLIESWKYDEDKLELIKSDGSADFNKIVSLSEEKLRNKIHSSQSSMFIERVQQANGSITLVSWSRPTSMDGCVLDTYFRVGRRIVRYQNDVSLPRKKIAMDFIYECSKKWREIDPSAIVGEVGFVVGDTILEDRIPNIEGWRMAIQLSGKPDVSFEIASYVQNRVGPGLRERAGGAVAGLLGSVAGLSRLRNRARPVGPIEADEILLAGTQNGKRGYGFKWEAPGKANSLAEPNLNVTLEVRESAYTTNNESFASDEEALELWDTVVDSIRLRPGAI
jgi:hypothetical protein